MQRERFIELMPCICSPEPLETQVDTVTLGGSELGGAIFLLR